MKQEQLKQNNKKLRTYHFFRSHFCIVGYDILSRGNYQFPKNFQVIIADESHYLKNHDSKRSKVPFFVNCYQSYQLNMIPPQASCALLKKAKRAILLSGTPALSRPNELFPQLNALYPDLFRSHHSL